MMRSPSYLFGKRKREYDNTDSIVGERNREFGTNWNLVPERETEITNPNLVLGEGTQAMENSAGVNEKSRNGGGTGERKCVVESSNSVVIQGKRDLDTPPVDDCCPICFGNFTIACKTNCGHWFCASCILQFWNYRAALQKCKCPICSRLISKLTPEASLLILQEEEVIEVLKNVQRYNSLFQGGARGHMVKVLELPHVIKRMFRGLMDPDRFRFNYYTMRFVALLLSCIYNSSPFDFIPTGGLGTRRLFDLCAISLVVILCLVGICRRLMLRRRVRLLAAAQT